MSEERRRLYLQWVSWELKRAAEFQKLLALLCMDLGEQPGAVPQFMWDLPRKNSKLTKFYAEIVYRGFGLQ